VGFCCFDEFHVNRHRRGTLMILGRLFSPAVRTSHRGGGTSKTFFFFFPLPKGFSTRAGLNPGAVSCRFVSLQDFEAQYGCAAFSTRRTEYFRLEKKKLAGRVKMWWLPADRAGLLSSPDKAWARMNRATPTGKPRGDISDQRGRFWQRGPRSAMAWLGFSVFAANLARRKQRKRSGAWIICGSRHGNITPHWESDHIPGDGTTP